MFEVARFDPALEAVGSCRRWVRDCLRDLVDPSVVQDAQLCVSELAANAVRHAASSFRVELRSDDARLRVSVHDDSPVPPARGVTREAGCGSATRRARTWDRCSMPRTSF